MTNRGSEMRAVGYRVGMCPAWSNPSVLALAGENDPIRTVIERARTIANEAIGEGWSGPPFDPRRLAEILHISLRPSGDVRDARISLDEGGNFRIEFNPSRPRVRQHFSIAHEIAHTFFPDCGEAVRNRALHVDVTESDRELELLCNLAAAELLMPAGSMPEIRREGSIDEALDLRQQFEVSTEAILVRTIQLTRRPLGMFSASRIERGQLAGRYRLDYAIESEWWQGEDLLKGMLLPVESPVQYCTGIGYTQKGPAGFGAEDALVECVGVTGFPGTTFPRVVGFVGAITEDRTSSTIQYLIGDVVEPATDGAKIVAFLTNDTTPNWGGGVARAVAHRRPEVQLAFRKLISTDAGALTLGSLHLINSGDTIYAPIVAQHGYGKSSAPRIRYNALAQALGELARYAAVRQASVHLPRIGGGSSGGRWEVVREMLEELVAPYVPVTVYDLPRAVRVRRASESS